MLKSCAGLVSGILTPQCMSGLIGIALKLAITTVATACIQQLDALPLNRLLVSQAAWIQEREHMQAQIAQLSRALTNRPNSG